MTLQHRVLANSLPCGGPFLLASALDLLGCHKFTGNAGTPRALNYLEAKNALAQESPTPASAATIGVSLFAPLSASPATINRWLAAVAPGDYLMGHMPWSAPLQEVMTDLAVRHVIILRDPRALLLALLFGDELMPRFLKADFAGLAPLQQIERMWLGDHLPQANVTLQPFATVYRSMVAWREQPNSLLVRFEDLVSPQAGGDRCRQQHVLKQIADFLEVTVNDAQLTAVDTIADPSSHTFPLGQKALWPQVVTPAVVAFAEENCAVLCQEAGYAQ